MCDLTTILIVLIIVTLYYLYRSYVSLCEEEEAAVVDDAVAEVTAEEEETEGFDADYSRGGDHYESTKMMALEPGVVSSHKKFVKELNHRTATASKLTVHDSFNPAVPWYGLPRKAMFARLGADRGARVVQSETPEQTMAFSMHNSNKYCL